MKVKLSKSHKAFLEAPFKIDEGLLRSMIEDNEYVQAHKGVYSA